jgi:hypothetical protein
MLIGQSLRAVDPVRMAVLTGITRQRFSGRTLVPSVFRPHLLTHQLRGCGCDCGSTTLGLPPDWGAFPRAYGGLSGLGQDGSNIYQGTFDPSSLPPNFNPNTLDWNNLSVPSWGTGNVSVLQQTANVGVTAAATAANFIPGVGPLVSATIEIFAHGGLKQLEAWLGIGAGRREADMIVPFQNQLVNQSLGAITNQILVGKAPALETLTGLYRQVWMDGVAFCEFVLLKNFTDRRASGQALNTIMPYIDGTGGYVPDDGHGHALHGIGFQATPGTFGSLSWGDGTIGGVGTDGMLGAIGRAITNMGGQIPSLIPVNQAANMGIRVPVGPGGGPPVCLSPGYPPGCNPYMGAGGGYETCIPGTNIPAGCTPAGGILGLGNISPVVLIGVIGLVLLSRPRSRR